MKICYFNDERKLMKLETIESHIMPSEIIETFIIAFDTCSVYIELCKGCGAEVREDIHKANNLKLKGNMYSRK